MPKVFSSLTTINPTSAGLLPFERCMFFDLELMREVPPSAESRTGHLKIKCSCESGSVQDGSILIVISVH